MVWGGGGRCFDYSQLLLLGPIDEDELFAQVKTLQQYREDGITTLQGSCYPLFVCLLLLLTSVCVCDFYIMLHRGSTV